ncbi:hypothetical protein ACJROX_13925 [Pseudalkalibacillus sp. A8]|uniref:hypothetical protein n=1 Tax=Pseudalkalibacillus sp. A8 TaxID=3382641 RepID=UPI0038B58725
MLNKNLLILMGGVLIAEMGMWLDLIGNLHFLQQHVSSRFLQSVILIVGTLVTILFSPAAGPLIDLME